MMGPAFLRNVTNGYVKMEQAPFAPAITRCYLMAILSIEHNLPQKFDLEAVAVASG